MPRRSWQIADAASRLDFVMPVYQLLGARGSLADLIASLDRSSDVFSLPVEVEREYQQRYLVQRFIQDHIQHKSVSLCRRGYRVTDAEGVATRVACDNAWLCAVCTPRRLDHFVAQTVEVIELASTVLSFTFSQIQETGEGLAVALNRLKRSMTSMTSGRAWADLKSRYGIVGIGYVVEVKHSPTGWHPHLHGFLVSDRDLSDEQASQLGLALRRRWSQQSAGSSLFAQHVAMVRPDEFSSATRYVKKDSPRYTTTSATNRTIGDLVHDASRGDLDALDLLQEVATATMRQRRFTWTPGIISTLQEATQAPLSA